MKTENFFLSRLIVFAKSVCIYAVLLGFLPLAVLQAQTGKQITVDEAEQIALQDSGLSSDTVTFKKSKQDFDHGIRVYEIDFFTDYETYEYEVNISSGEIVSKKVEKNTSMQKTSSKDTYIGIENAKSIAFKHAKVVESDVAMKKSRIDYDDGRAEYEIEFYVQNKKYEYSIDALNGRILDWDIEHHN